MITNEEGLIRGQPIEIGGEPPVAFVNFDGELAARYRVWDEYCAMENQAIEAEHAEERRRQ